MAECAAASCGYKCSRQVADLSQQGLQMVDVGDRFVFGTREWHSNSDWHYPVQRGGVDPPL